MVLPMWVFWVALAVMTVGLLGVILPVVPGVGLVWLAMLVYAIAEQFATIDPFTFSILTVLGAIGFTADLWMSHAGAKVGGASIWSLLAGGGLGAIGAIVGLVFLGVGAIPGAIIGAVAGVVLAEWYQRRDWREAFKAGGGWLVGCTISGGVQFVIAVLMIVIFVWQVLRG
ncbi:MAG: DUF456 family protein [Chloroflexota bacterium]|nr:DUF456 family protein [Chloroflexota bacterium]